jgi:hypothetical protein
MGNDRLTREAKALAVCLQEMWDRVRHDTQQAARLVALAERAQRRYVRRAARLGDPRAMSWQRLLAGAAMRARERGQSVNHAAYAQSR